MTRRDARGCTTDRVRLILGLFAPALFLLSLIVFGRLNPHLSHAHSAVSRLGAFDSNAYLAFDLLGLFLPGAFEASAAAVLWRWEGRDGSAKWSSRALFWFAVMNAFTATPADFQRMFSSPFTAAHTIFVLAAPLIFFASVKGVYQTLIQLGAPESSALLFLCLGYLPILEFLLYGAFPTTPGLIQRLIIATVHASMAWYCWVLLSISRRQPTG